MPEYSLFSLRILMDRSLVGEYTSNPLPNKNNFLILSSVMLYDKDNISTLGKHSVLNLSFDYTEPFHPATLSNNDMHDYYQTHLNFDLYDLSNLRKRIRNPYTIILCEKQIF